MNIFFPFKKERRVDTRSYEKIVVIVGGAGYVGKALLEVCRDIHNILFVVISKRNIVSGDNVISMRADMTDHPEKTVQKLLQMVGRIDVLVHAAATYSFETAEHLTAKNAVKEFEVNTILPLLVTQEACRQYWDKRGKEENQNLARKVIVIGSISGDGKTSRDNLIIYSATKAALFVAWQYYEDFLVKCGIESFFLKPGGLQEKKELDDFVRKLKEIVVS